MADNRNIEPVNVGRRSNVALLLRDNFTISTWVSIGAVIQSVAFSILGRLAFLPAICLLVYRIADAYAMITGLKHDHYMDGIIKEKVSAQFLGAIDGLDENAGNSDVCVFIIGSRVHHPLGLFAPGYKNLGAYFTRIVEELKENRQLNGFLGSRAILGATSPTNNENMHIMYFKSSEHVQAYATGPLHRQAVAWWTKHLAKHPHIGIFHELYHVPKKNWETLYAQMKPTLAGATQHRVVDVGKEEDAGAGGSPLVAAKGVLRTSLGRMGRLPGTFERLDQVALEGEG